MIFRLSLVIGLLASLLFVKGNSIQSSTDNIIASKDWMYEIDSLNSLLKERNTSEEGHNICQIGATYYRNFDSEKGLQYLYYFWQWA